MKIDELTPEEAERLQSHVRDMFLLQNRPQTFRLVRDEDVSGVSGTGVVAEGCQFSTGKVVLAWVSQYQSVAVYDSLEYLKAIHGHGGKTRVEWTH